MVERIHKKVERGCKEDRRVEMRCREDPGE